MSSRDVTYHVAFQLLSSLSLKHQCEKLFILFIIICYFYLLYFVYYFSFIINHLFIYYVIIYYFLFFLYATVPIKRKLIILISKLG